MSESRPSTAVIILNWNGSALLRRFLPSVVAHTPSTVADVIVADNGSTDNSLEVLAQEFPTVKVLKLSENYGFAEGYNRALAQTRYRYTVLLNSDAEASPGWIEPLVQYMQSHPECGAAQPKLLSVEHRDTFEYAGGCGGYLDRHGYPYCRGRIFNVVEKDRGQYDDIRNDLHWATGAALIVDTESYLAAGGLDTSFFAHMEEIDLCWRLRLMGKTIAVVPQSRVYHLGGGSLPAENPRKTYLNFRNNLLMLHKNLPVAERRRALFVRRLLDTVAWTKFALTFDWKNAAAVFRAHRDYRRMCRNIKESNPTTNLLAGCPDLLRSFYIERIKVYSAVCKD